MRPTSCAASSRRAAGTTESPFRRVPAARRPSRVRTPPRRNDCRCHRLAERFLGLVPPRARERGADPQRSDARSLFGIASAEEKTLTASRCDPLRREVARGARAPSRSSGRGESPAGRRHALHASRLSDVCLSELDPEVGKTNPFARPSRARGPRRRGGRSSRSLAVLVTEVSVARSSSI